MGVLPCPDQGPGPYQKFGHGPLFFGQLLSPNQAVQNNQAYTLSLTFNNIHTYNVITFVQVDVVNVA